MKIFLDSIIFSIQKQGGISIYWMELLKRMNSNDEFEYQVTLYGNNTNKNKNEIISLKESKNFTIKKSIEILPINVLRFIPFIKLDKSKFIFHSSYLNFVLSFGKSLNILTIHDLGYESNVTQSGIKRIVNIIFKYIALKNCDAIICVSSFTQMQLNKYYPFCKSKFQKVIYNGVSDFYYKIDKFNYENSVNYNNLPNRFILFIGTRYDYKNFDLAVSILADMVDYHLVIVGGGEFNSNEILDLNRKIGDRFIHFESVDISFLNIIYNKAHCLLYPSIYEGFGIPILEAMKSGCPFISYKIPSIAEITKDKIYLLELESKIDDFIFEIKKLENLDFRNVFINLGFDISANFSWDKCYIETIKFYKEVLNKI